ncbi:MAG: lysylphosphatidylglycerol synthase transmembrane domain-containing protein [Bacteroidia bacterium]
MNPKAKSILQFVILLGLGILLVWLSLRQVADKKDEIFSAFRNADYFWVGISTLIGFFSHFLRAYRWNYLLKPLGYKASLFNATSAVFIGYFANYGLPRMGEVSRCTIVDRYEKIPFQTGFGTVVTERIIDFVLLIFIFVLTLLFQFAELGNLAEEYIFSGMRKKLHVFIENPVLGILAGVIVAGMIVALYLLRHKISGALKGKFGNFIKGFGEGLSSVKKLENLPAFIGLSLLIWLCYFYSLYTCLQALPETAVITQKGCLTLMLFGTFGVIFTPGGLGAYHAIITGILIFYGVTQIPAVAMPWLTWTSQFILVVILGLISLVLLPIVNKKKNELSPEVEPKAND